MWKHCRPEIGAIVQVVRAHAAEDIAFKDKLSKDPFSWRGEECCCDESRLNDPETERKTKIFTMAEVN